MSRNTKNAPGRVRDAILSVLSESPTSLSVATIIAEVQKQVRDAPPSSVRSYLRLNTPELFVRETRGAYRASRLTSNPWQKSLSGNRQKRRQFLISDVRTSPRRLFRVVGSTATQLNSCGGHRSSLWSARIYARTAAKTSRREGGRMAHSAVVRWTPTFPDSPLHDARHSPTSRSSGFLYLLGTLAAAGVGAGRECHRCVKPLGLAHRCQGIVGSRTGTARRNSTPHHDDARRRPPERRARRISTISV